MATARTTRSRTRSRTTQGKNGGAGNPAELKTLAVYEKYVLGTARFMEIPTKDLFVDNKYQRDLNEAQVKRITNNFDTDLFEPPTVNDRSGWGTGYKGKRFALIDGQHRKEAALRINKPSITCRVVSVAPEREAELFVLLNRQRLWLNPIQSFKAELSAGNPAAKEIVNTLNDRGLDIGHARYTAQQRANGKTIMAIAALKRIYAQSGSVGLGRVLDVANEAWPEDDSQRFAGQVLLGIDLFLGKNRNTDLERLSYKLQNVTSRQLLAKATARWHAWKGLGEGRESTRSVIDAVSEEIKKVYRRHA